MLSRAPPSKRLERAELFAQSPFNRAPRTGVVVTMPRRSTSARLGIGAAAAVAAIACGAVARADVLHATYRVSLIGLPIGAANLCASMQDRDSHGARVDAAEMQRLVDLLLSSGGVQCTKVKGGKEYHCAFGVELQTQHVVSGVAC